MAMIWKTIAYYTIQNEMIELDHAYLTNFVVIKIVEHALYAPRQCNCIIKSRMQNFRLHSKGCLRLCRGNEGYDQGSHSSFITPLIELIIGVIILIMLLVS